MIMDSAGNLYGTTGHLNDNGTIFEVSKTTGVVTTLASFPAAPVGRLLLDSAGDLFGTTAEGADGDVGTVFELASGSSSIITLASFNGANGSTPQAGLIMDSAGNLFGTTALGGANNDGTVFEIVHGSGVITTLASAGPLDADGPDSDLVMDSAGNLYGTDPSGGVNGLGSVFELVRGSSTFTVLASFNSTNGTNPIGLVMDSAGNFFECHQQRRCKRRWQAFVRSTIAAAAAITTVASFNGTNGSIPQGTLLSDAAGDLFGTTLSRWLVAQTTMARHSR